MENLEKKLIDAFNESQIPFEAKRYVVKHVLEVVNHEYDKQMALMSQKESEKKEETEK
ncbi:MAG: hypothetical protein J6Y02_22285 [Pseudobutyrivibrio sp.]|nr:hypothetical protein [Pseudobutyrivibrio sp.]